MWLDIDFIDGVARRLSSLIPIELSDIRQDLERNFCSLLQGVFAKLDLVTREEFDAQKAVLARTRCILEQLEKKLSALEQRLKVHQHH